MHERGARAGRGVAWAALEQWGTQVLGLLAFLLLSRLLEPAEFGLLAMAGAVIALLQAIVEQGFADAVVQRRRIGRGHLDAAFWSTVGLGLLAGGLVVSVAGPIAALFSAPELAPIVAVLAATVPITALGSIHHALLRRRIAFRPLAARALIANLVGGVVAVTVAVRGGGVWSLVVQALVTAATGTILLWTAVRWRPRLRYDVRRFRQIGGYAGNVSAANVVNFANRYADDVIIGLALGPIALGYYTVAYRLLWSWTRVLAGVASTVAFPAFARLHADLERLRKDFYAAVRVVALISFPLFVGMALLAPALIVSVFGEQWSPAAPALRVLCAIGILHSVGYLNTSLLMAAGKPAWVLRLNLLNGLLNVIAFAIGVRWGIVGVATAYVVRGYLTSPLPLVLLRRALGLDLKEYARQLSGAAAACVVMAASVALVESMIMAGPVGRLLAGTAVGVLIYLFVVRYFDRKGSEILRRALQTLRRTPPAREMLSVAAGPGG
ncbi:MAG: lipopolysaccharide biosynthesis protein [Longimicrobiales bacterium]